MPSERPYDQRVTATQVRPLLGQTVDGRYFVQAHLADGGMGSVYVALDTRLDRRVALKVMREDLARDQGLVERFQREARSAARLSHPAIVAVYDQGGQDGLVWLAMELVGEGRTLRTWLAEVGALTPREALRVWTAMLQALDVAHRADLLHRDVKPENVLLGPGQETGSVKVADFGLSRPITTQTLTTVGSNLFGTVSYLSPEQIQTGRADARSDLYAAGLVLFEMLTGQKAVSGESMIQVAYQHVHGIIPVPSAVTQGLPDELDALCAWATQRDPDARPSDAATLLAQVEASSAALTQSQLDARPVVEGFQDSASNTARLIQPTRRVPLIPPTESKLDAESQAAQGPEAIAALPPTAGVVLPVGASLPRKVKRIRGPRRPLKPWATWLLRTFTVVLLIAAGVYGYLFYGPAGTRIVPDVVKQPQAQAAMALSAADLDATIMPSFSEDIPRGLVISAEPSPGSETKRGRTVRLVVSNGKERHEVPTVTKLTSDQAGAALIEHKLAIGQVQEEYSETLEAGVVTRADPATGARLKPNTAVNLWVSKGKRPIPVPSYVGKPLQDAKNALNALDLEAVVTKEEFSNEVPKGSVIAQDPVRGTIYRKNTIRFVVSKGPDLITVPEVSGKQESEAVAQLTQAGFKVEVNRRLGGIFGTAHSTDPQEGSPAGRGSTVTLNVV